MPDMLKYNMACYVCIKTEFLRGAERIRKKISHVSCQI